MKELDKLNRLAESHGALRPGKGLITGVIERSLATLCFLGVLAFHFPEYLTTLHRFFGTAVQSDRAWPEHYGVVGDYGPNGFFKQLVFPFRWKA